MNQFKEMEQKLNQSPTPLDFQGLYIANMRFVDNTLQIKIVLTKNKDTLKILEDEDHCAILKVVYSGINIKKLNYKEIIDFRYSTIETLKEKEDGLIEFKMFSTILKNTFALDFTCKKYEWKITDIIETKEYLKYSEMFADSIDHDELFGTYKGTTWSEFNKE